MWKKCSSCKHEIQFGDLYWTCNVSTCNRKRTGLVFCTVSCWDAHVPGMNHRESWAEEHTAPTKAEWAKILLEESQPKKRQAKPEPKPEPSLPERKKPTAPIVIRRRSSDSGNPGP